MNTRSRTCHPIRLVVRTAAGFLSASVLLSAQTAPVASPSAALPPEKTEPIVELSVFEVRSDKDVGYQAGNTVSGSRLDSRLKDTPAAISAFTAEFLSDIAATNLQDMLGYALFDSADRLTIQPAHDPTEMTRWLQQF